MDFEEIYNSRKWTDANETQLHETSGVYLIEFPNGKKYVGSTKNLFERLSTHLRHLQTKSEIFWYKQAAIENNFPDNVPSEKPKYEPPEHPESKRDKRGFFIGARASKKSIELWEKEKSKYDLIYKQQFNKWLKANPNVTKVRKTHPYIHYVYEIPWRYYATLVKITVCSCDDYKEYESELLKSIKDHENWYNKIFK